MKSELLILWAEKVSVAAICNLGEAFMTIYKKRSSLSLHICDACILKHTIFLNHVLLGIGMKHVVPAAVRSVFPLQIITVQRRSNKECKCTLYNYLEHTHTHTHTRVRAEYCYYD